MTLPSLLLINLSSSELVTHSACMFVFLCSIWTVYKYSRETKALSAKGHQLFSQSTPGSWICSGQFETIIVFICHNRLFTGACLNSLFPYRILNTIPSSLLFKLLTKQLQDDSQGEHGGRHRGWNYLLLCVYSDKQQPNYGEFPDPPVTLFWKNVGTRGCHKPSKSQGLLFFIQSSCNVALGHLVHTKNM